MKIQQSEVLILGPLGYGPSALPLCQFTKNKILSGPFLVYSAI